MTAFRRQHLPHFHYGKHQIITYRLDDALPQHMLTQIQQQTSPQIRKKLTEQILDTGYGSCILRQPEIAQIVLDNWLFFNQKRYDLIAYVVMPNHVHVLIELYSPTDLVKIIQSWKSYTAHQITKIYPNYQKIWQKNYWDRYIRDETHLHQAIWYIEQNPVKAGLVDNAEQWQFSSAYLP